MAAVSRDEKLLLPPDEQFWTRYSPHHEFPLAGMTSFFIHGLVFGLLALAGFWYLFQRESENNKPPSMDLVQIAGGGDGFEGAGGDPGLPGKADPAQTEFVPNPMTNATETLPDLGNNLKEAPQVELSIPEVNFSETKTDVEAVLANLAKDAANQAKKENSPVPRPTKSALPGTGNPKGVGGQGGSGGGPGKGSKGTGPGAGGPGGPKTKAEIYARRWQFNLSGLGKDHVEKYLAMGAKVAVLAPNREYLFIHDLRRRPVDLQPGKLPSVKDVVMWGNSLPESIERLAAELKLPFVPSTAYAHLGVPAVAIFLPKEREQNFADEEMRYAKKMGRRPDQIEATLFDFRLRDGRYEPVVIGQK